MNPAEFFIYLDARREIAHELAEFLREQANTYSYTRAAAFRSAAAKIDPECANPRVKGYWNQDDWKSNGLDE